MASIFISYDRKSEVIVRALSEDIAVLGHTVWLDQELKGMQPLLVEEEVARSLGTEGKRFRGRVFSGGLKTSATHRQQHHTDKASTVRTHGGSGDA